MSSPLPADPHLLRPIPRPVVLCILDGWGYREESENNAIAQANLVSWRRLWASCPHALLVTSGLAVGLPEGQMGNSEVGHLTIGAGRVVMQELPKIDQAIASGALAHNEQLLALIAKAKAAGGACHLMGLASDGGVHAHIDHIKALAQLVADQGVPVWLHAFTDGRDVPPHSAEAQLGALVENLPKGAQLATVMGRYYAMDRDKRWERIEKAYKAIVGAKGETAEQPDIAQAAILRREIARSYTAGTSDEFILPMVSPHYSGMKEGDVVLFANFRADRARQILSAVLDPAFDGFVRTPAMPKLAGAAGMVVYSSAHEAWMQALFPPKELSETLGEVVSKAGKTQLRMAETEKYAHVTFFLNGGEEKVYAGEDRILVPSPKVATYDLQPEMSAEEVGDKAVAAIESGKYDLMVINFANPDMVGHTGDLKAAIAAVEAVDKALGRIDAALMKAGGALLVTADHGNCEEMWDSATGGPHTQHSLNPVPVLLMGGPAGCRLRDGSLADLAPTVLELLKLPQPAVMSGRSLIQPA